MKKYFYFLLLALLYIVPRSQENPSEFRYWFNMGLGINNSSTAAFGANLNFSTWNFYSQIGYQSIHRNIGEFNGDNQFKEFPLYSINLGIGDVLIKENIFSSIMIGPAFTWGSKIDESPQIINSISIDKEVDFYTLGLVFNSQLFFTFIKEMGIGLELFGNLNPTRSLAEIKISIHFNSTNFGDAK